MKANETWNAGNEGSHYDEIMSHQRITMLDLKTHAAGPLIAIVTHIIILSLVIMMVVIPAQEIITGGPQIETVPDDNRPPPEVPPQPDETWSVPTETVQVSPVERPPLDNDPIDEIDDPKIEFPPNIPSIDFTPPPRRKGNPEIPGGGYGEPGDGDGKGPRKGRGTGLEGTFYDLKQTTAGAVNDMSVEHFKSVMREFVTSNWRSTILNPYFKPSLRLYANCFFIPRSSANDAPKAYRCDDKVKPSRWAAIYRGRVIAPKTGRYRFVGAGDDNISVRFNNETVLDYGWTMLSLGVQTTNEWKGTIRGNEVDPVKRTAIESQGIYTFPITLYKYAKTNHWNNALGGLAAGKIVEVEAGKVYPIEVLITEIPGGEFGAALLIEDLAMTEFYPKDDKTGSPILPLFRTANVTPSHEMQTMGECPPFFPGGEIWRVAPVGYTPSKKVAADDESLIIIN